MKFKLHFTTTKLMAYLIFLVGAFVGLVYKEIDTMYSCIGIAAALIGGKTMIDRAGDLLQSKMGKKEDKDNG